MDCPRIVIAGTHSGVGKTSLSLAITRALTRRGLCVQTFKVGPDFLDPSHLALASGRPCYNLDGWMMGTDYVSELFARTAAGADFAIIEGVMGLFDGADPATIEGSTAEIARLLQAPVILVADAHGTARSLAAVVKGFAGFEPGVCIAGVIANRCGSERHAAWLADSLAAAGLPGLVGAVPRGALPELCSRHLGLVTADSRNLSQHVLDALADAVETHAAVENVVRLGRSAPPVVVHDRERASTARRLRLGIAFDEAFHFYYQDLFDELEFRGCELVRFSPVHDSCLPDGLHAVYMGGGYPEEYAEALSANAGMLSDIRGFAASGRPVYAECGGLMYLSREVETLDGKRYPLVGLLPVGTRMLDRKRALGYVEVTMERDSIWSPGGGTLRGHEFHYSELAGDPTEDGDWQSVYSVRRRRSEGVTAEGFSKGHILASYAHLHPASHPGAVDRFVANCEASL